jgi:hypothetical protein
MSKIAPKNDILPKNFSPQEAEAVQEKHDEGLRFTVPTENYKKRQTDSQDNRKFVRLSRALHAFEKAAKKQMNKIMREERSAQEYPLRSNDNHQTPINPNTYAF